MKNTLNRRRFLAAATVAVASPMVLPSRIFSQESPNEKMDFACLGMGGQMMGYCVPELLKVVDPQQITAICDVDNRKLQEAGDRFPDAKRYRDYRELLDTEKSVDAVLIATPDHWHVPMIQAALKKKKHVYCEKPLAHSVSECREILKAVADAPECVTQTGNQGCATEGFRRSFEVIQAGLLGQVTDVHIWGKGRSPHWGMEMPPDSDPVPEGLDWDFWLGPAPERHYKEGLYHPANWRSWWDFGGGFIEDFCCHCFPLAVRSLNLGKPTQVEVQVDGISKDSYPAMAEVISFFPAVGNRAAVRIHFHSGTMENLPQEATRGFTNVDDIGCVLIGEKGTLNSGLWNTNCGVRWKDSDAFVGDNDPAIAAIPKTLPRIDTDKLNWNPRYEARGERPRWSRVNSTHMLEWVMACQGDTKTFSPFEIGAKLTEIGMIAVLACRLGKGFRWNDETMSIENVPEADKWITPKLREKYLPG